MKKLLWVIVVVVALGVVYWFWSNGWQGTQLPKAGTTGGKPAVSPEAANPDSIVSDLNSAAEAESLTPAESDTSLTEPGSVDSFDQSLNTSQF